jgi:asparagine synthetase B (glutamine-hydrolysing)
VGGPASIVFHRGDRSSSSLADLVDSRTPIDALALAGWVLRWPPNRPDETMYRGVDAELATSPLRRVHTGAPPSLAEAPAFLRRALDDAVDVALQGVRRAAVMTGGGLDSSVMLGLTMRWAERTGGSAFAVSLDYEAPGDDRPHLAALERHLDCEVIRVTPEECAPQIAMLAAGADAAPAYAATMPLEVEMLERARANGAERLLSGAGGDELFGGEPRALADVAMHGHPIRAVRAARRINGFGRPRSPTWSWVVRPLLARTLPTAVRVWRARRHAPCESPAWGGPVVRSFLEEKRRLLGDVAGRQPRTAEQRFESIRDDDRRPVLAWGRQLEEQLTGVDCWDPYLDLDLAAAIAFLPPEYLLSGDRWRGLLREAARDLLPVTVRERMDKASFEPALRRFVDAAGGLEALRPLASGRELASLGLVEPRELRAAFDRFVTEPEDGVSWVGLWSALAVEAFLRGRAT